MRPKDYWWQDDRTEIYWVEIRHEPGIGSELRAPRTDANGNPNPWYDLLDAVQPGDVIYHWHALEHRFVGWSRARARVRLENELRIVLLEGFTPLDTVIDLRVLRVRENELQRAREKVGLRAGNESAYLPFQFRSDGLRMMSNYFTKLPKLLIPVLFAEHPGEDGTAAPTEASTVPTGHEARDATGMGLRTTFLQPFKEKADADYIAHIAPRLERRGRSHETLVNAFARWLERAGFQVQRNQAIDLAVAEPLVIIEAKILPQGPVHDQIRQAVGQLYEYRFFQVVPRAAKLLFLGSRPLTNEWVHYLEDDREVAVVWQDGERFEFSQRARTMLRLTSPQS